MLRPLFLYARVVDGLGLWWFALRAWESDLPCLRVGLPFVQANTHVSPRWGWPYREAMKYVMHGVETQTPLLVHITSSHYSSGHHLSPPMRQIFTQVPGHHLSPPVW
jgi:hypothetical protein